MSHFSDKNFASTDIVYTVSLMTVLYYRVGGEENFFHCSRCDMCLGIQLKDSHKVGEVLIPNPQCKTNIVLIKHWGHFYELDIVPPMYI